MTISGQRSLACVGYVFIDGCSYKDASQLKMDNVS